MIKAVIALFAFAVVLCIWIVDPFGLATPVRGVATVDRLGDVAPDDVVSGRDLRDVPDPAPEVTRGAVTAPVLVLAPMSATSTDVPGGSVLAAASVVSAAPPAPAVVPSFGAVVSVHAPDPGMPPEICAGGPVAAQDGASCGIDPELTALVAAILGDLGVQPAVPAVPIRVTDQPTPPAAPGTDDPLAAQLAEALAGIASVTGTPPPTGASADAAAALAAIVAEALRQGHGDAAISAEVDRAVRTGTVPVPGILIRADGAVDSDVLLQAVMRTAQGRMGAGLQAAQFDGPTGVTHEVAATESLAAIALAYYGDPARTGAILSANAGTLASAAEIAAGQTLVIPTP